MKMQEEKGQHEQYAVDKNEKKFYLHGKDGRVHQKSHKGKRQYLSGAATAILECLVPNIQTFQLNYYCIDVTSK